MSLLIASDLVVTIFKLGVNFIREVPEIMREVQNDAHFIARSHGDHQKTFEVVCRSFPSITFRYIDGNRGCRPPQLRRYLAPLESGEFRRDAMNLNSQLISQLASFRVTV